MQRPKPQTRDISSRPNILLTGASGYVGSALLPRLLREGHAVRAFARDPSRVAGGVEVIRGDAVTGAGLDEALSGIDVAYYLIHSMEPGADGFASATSGPRSGSGRPPPPRACGASSTWAGSCPPATPRRT